MIRIGTGLLAAISLVAAAQAEQLYPSQAKSIELDGTTGVAYYTVADDGFRVVATLAAGESGAPMRFVATLVAGQSVVLSVPRALNQTSREVEIKRDNDVVTVSDISAPTARNEVSTKHQMAEDADNGDRSWANGVMHITGEKHETFR